MSVQYGHKQKKESKGYIIMFIKYETNAGYRITTISGAVYTCSGTGVYTSIGRIIENDSDIASIVKFCDDYKAHILKVARGEA